MRRLDDAGEERVRPWGREWGVVFDEEDEGVDAAGVEEGGRDGFGGVTAWEGRNGRVRDAR